MQQLAHTCTCTWEKSCNRLFFIAPMEHEWLYHHCICKVYIIFIINYYHKLCCITLLVMYVLIYDNNNIYLANTTVIKSVVLHRYNIRFHSRLMHEGCMSLGWTIGCSLVICNGEGGPSDASWCVGSQWLNNLVRFLATIPQKDHVRPLVSI